MRKPPCVFTGSARQPALIICILLLGLVVFSGPLQAQEKPAVQQLTGQLDPKESVFYVLRHLKKGQTLYLYAEGTSGDFDPVLVLLKPEVDFARVLQIQKDELDKAIAEGRDPLAVRDEAVQKYTLAFNDDTGAGYVAAVKVRFLA